MLGLIGWVVLGVLSASPNAEAEEVEPPFWSVHAWTAQDGLPQNGASGLAQDAQGILWVGTYGGLVRFDGATFEPGPSLRWPRVSAMARGPPGVLWIGHLRGGLTRLGSDGDLRTLEPGQVSGFGRIRHLEWRGDRLMVSGLTGCAELGRDGRRIRHWNVGPCAIAQGPDGSMWLAAQRVLNRLDPEGLHPLGATSELRSLQVDPSGRPWILDDAGLSVALDGELHRVVSMPVSSEGAPLGIGPDGRVWFGSGTAAYHTSLPSVDGAPGPVSTAPLERIELSRSVRTLRVDPDGRGVWVGSFPGGLHRIEPASFRQVELTPTRLAGVRGVAFDGRGRLWFGHGCRGLHRREPGGEVVRVLEDFCVAALHWDRKTGLLHVAGGGLWTVRSDGTVRRVPTPDLPASAVWAEDGVSMFGTADGRAFRREGGVLRSLEAPLSERIGVIVQDPRGRWLFGENGRLGIWDGMSWSVLDETDGVPPGEIRGIAFAADGMWVATYGAGLGWIGERSAFVFDRSHGLPTPFLASVVRADGGPGSADGAFLVANGNEGLFRVAEAELSAVAQGRKQRARVALLGTPESEFGHPGVARAPDGRLWFSTLFGLVELDVPAASRPLPTPQVIVQHAEVDGRALDPSGVTRLPPGPGRLRLRFTVPEYRRPRTTGIEFRASEDEPWRAVGDRSLTIGGLDPGPHEIQLRAVGLGGPGPVSRLSFVLQRHWSRTLAFRLALLAGVLALLAGLHRWRTRVLLAVSRSEKELAERSAQNRQLEAMGRLAGGVAHDVNNMLTAVRGQTDGALDSLERSDRDGAIECLRGVLDATERTVRITQQLLQLGRARAVTPAAVDVSRLLSGLKPTLERLVPDHVELQWRRDPGPLPVVADGTHVEQIVMNLVLNAVQAMPEGGIIDVGCARAEPGWVRLFVSDEGLGMTEETRKRIFEPFFSTKEGGENTGLGLTVVLSAVERWSGWCEVHSALGLGTRFDVFLPAAEAGACEDNEEKTPVPRG